MRDGRAPIILHKNVDFTGEPNVGAHVIVREDDTELYFRLTSTTTFSCGGDLSPDDVRKLIGLLEDGLRALDNAAARREMDEAART